MSKFDITIATQGDGSSNTNDPSSTSGAIDSDNTSASGTPESSETSKSSETLKAVSVPDTGSFTNNNLFSQPLIGISILLLVGIIVASIIKRQKSHKIFSLNKNFKTNQPLKVIGSSFALSIITISLVVQFTNQNITNDNAIATDANDTLAIEVEDINLNITRQNSESAYGFTKNNIIVKTPTTDGYTLKAYSSQTTDLTSKKDHTKKIKNTTKQNDALSSNSWGISIQTPTDQNSKVWSKMPLSESSAITLKSTNSATNANDTTEVYYGAYIDSDLPDDTYSGVTINYVVVANATPDQTDPITPTPTEDKIHFIVSGSYLIESNGHYGLVDSLFGLIPSDVNDVTTCYGAANCVNHEWQTVQHLANYLRSLNVKSLDFVISSHSHSDHIGGMPLIARDFVDSNTKYYYREYTGTREDILYDDWYNELHSTRALNAMAQAGATLIEVTDKHPSFQFGDFHIDIMNTEPATSDEISLPDNMTKGENKNSIVILATHGSTKALLTNDMEFEDEPKIANEVGEIDILQMGHHGYPTSTGINFIDTLKPKDIIIPRSLTEPGMAYASMYYAGNRWDANIHTTQDTEQKIIVATFNNDSYSLDGVDETLSKSKVNISDIETDGVCKKVKFYNEQANTTVHLVIENNRPVIGWKKINCWGEGEKTIYADAGGNFAKGWVELELNGTTSWFYFDESNGYMAKGWRQINWQGEDSWFYFDQDGRMQTGWQKLEWNGGTYWFYFGGNGKMVSGTTITIGGSEYTFDDSGVCRIGNGCN